MTADLEKQIASFSTLRDQHGAEITDQKREMDRLRKAMAGFHSKNARLQRKIQDRENARDVAIADRDLTVADRDKLRAHLAQLASGFPFAVASAPASSDSKRNRSDKQWSPVPAFSGFRRLLFSHPDQDFDAICPLEIFSRAYAIISSHAIS